MSRRGNNSVMRNARVMFNERVAIRVGLEFEF
jgi:hypothetical protein